MLKDQLPMDYRTLPGLIKHKRESVPDDVFFHYERQSMTYEELDIRTNQFANAFLQEGISPGDRVCLYLYNSTEYLCAYLGLTKIGAIAVPVDTRFVSTALEYILSETEPELTLIDSRTIDEYNSVPENIRGSIDVHYVGTDLDSSEYTLIESIISHGEELDTNYTPAEDDVLSLIYVQRKADQDPIGIALPHFSYINTGWEVGKTIFKFDSRDKIFAPLPLYSIFTMQLGIMPSLITDCEFVLGDRFYPETFWETVEETNATIFLYLSRMLSILYNSEKASNYTENPAERAIGHGFGFENDKELIESFENMFNLTVLEGYGVTQAATIVTYNTLEKQKRGSVGQPVSHVEVQIVDDKDRPVKRGETGEILVRPTRPNSMMIEYYNQPEKTVRDCRNQWIHTGDLGYLDEDGFLYFIANEQNSIYRGRIGGQISTLEIESVINSIPAVRECAVVGIENSSRQEEIKAIVSTKEGESIDEIDICKHCEEQLAYAKVPRFIELRDTLPRSPTGKIQKNKLSKTNSGSTWDKTMGYDLSR